MMIIVFRLGVLFSQKLPTWQKKHHTARLLRMQRLLTTCGNPGEKIKKPIGPI